MSSEIGFKKLSYNGVPVEHMSETAIQMYMDYVCLNAAKSPGPSLIVTGDPKTIQRAKELGLKMSPVKNIDGVWYISTEKAAIEKIAEEV